MKEAGISWLLKKLDNFQSVLHLTAGGWVTFSMDFIAERPVRLGKGPLPVSGGGVA